MAKNNAGWALVQENWGDFDQKIVSLRTLWHSSEFYFDLFAPKYEQ